MQFPSVRLIQTERECQIEDGYTPAADAADPDRLELIALYTLLRRHYPDAVANVRRLATANDSPTERRAVDANMQLAWSYSERADYRTIAAGLLAAAIDATCGCPITDA